MSEPVTVTLPEASAQMINSRRPAGIFLRGLPKREVRQMLSPVLQKETRQIMRDGERITSTRIVAIPRKYANCESVPLKSSHKLRKTYASNLNASGVPLDCIREMLGHSSLSTTLGYIYNPLTNKETYDLITRAL